MKFCTNLTVPQGPRNPDSLWDFYKQCLDQVRAIISQTESTRPALASDCKLCHWRSTCKRQLKNEDDLSLIFELGRAKRDVMISELATVKALSNADIDNLSRGEKTVSPRIGINNLRKFQNRARLLTEPSANPSITRPFELPTSEIELFFDIETDPMRDICYLHGFVERRLTIKGRIVTGKTIDPNPLAKGSLPENKVPRRLRIKIFHGNRSIAYTYETSFQ